MEHVIIEEKRREMEVGNYLFKLTIHPNEIVIRNLLFADYNIINGIYDIQTFAPIIQKWNTGEKN